MHIFSLPPNHLYARVITLIIMITTAYPSQTQCMSIAKNIGQTALAGAVILGGTYLLGRATASMYVYTIKRQYAEALFIWKQNQDDLDTACAELTRYILKNHIRNRWFDNTYTNYPLVEYVNCLDSVLFWLWALSLFTVKTKTYTTMHTIRKDLTAIKQAIIGDYTYTKEKREFDQWIGDKRPLTS